MNNQSDLQSKKPKSSLWKGIAIGGCGVVILGVLCVTGLFAFALWGGGGEPASFAVPNRIDPQFVQAVHDQKLDVAYAMLSEKLTSKISKEQFAVLLQKDQKLFSTYKKLDVCNWGFFIRDGRVITSSGLLYYEGGTIVVEISLLKDTDTIWRIQDFQFRPDVAPKPFGLCE